MTKTYLYNIRNHINRAITTVMPVKKEKLTAEKMQELFGTNYNNILYYNFDTKKWSAKHYIGFHIPAENMKSKYTSLFKDMLHSMRKFAGYELAGIAFMTIDQSQYAGWKRDVVNPTFKPDSAFVAKIICRDKKTGKIVPVSNSWFGVNNFNKAENAVRNGTLYFLRDGCMFPDVRADLIKQHIR